MMMVVASHTVYSVTGRTRQSERTHVTHADDEPAASPTSQHTAAAEASSDRTWETSSGGSLSRGAPQAAANSGVPNVTPYRMASAGTKMRVSQQRTALPRKMTAGPGSAGRSRSRASHQRRTPSAATAVSAKGARARPPQARLTAPDERGSAAVAATGPLLAGLRYFRLAFA